MCVCVGVCVKASLACGVHVDNTFNTNVPFVITIQGEIGPFALLKY